MKVGELLITMASDIARVKKDMDEVQKHTKRTADVAESAARLVRNAFAGLSVAFLAREFISLADASTNMDARLKLAAKSTDDYNAAQKDVYRIAQAMRVPLEGVTTLYARMSDPIRKLGGGTREAAAITEAFSAALRISGATTAEASSATIQFSQAMASGVLRGEEFNSVNEAAPRVMQALEASLGKTRGELRKMAEQGLLTSDVVANALIKQFVALKVEAESMPLTVGAAMTQIRNDLLVFAGVIDNATGATSGLASIISGVSMLLGQFSIALKLSGDSASGAARDVDIAGLTIAAVGTVLETLIVVGANVAYVFKAIALEVSGLANQAGALARGDFAEVARIHSEMKAAAEENRSAIDKFSASVIGSTQRVLEQRDALRLGSISASENKAELTRLMRQGQQTEMSVAALTIATKSHSDATKLSSSAIKDKNKAEAEAKKAAEESAKARFESIDATLKESEAIAEQVRQLEEETLKMGMSREELHNLERARLDEAIATARQRLEVAIANGIRGEELDGITLTVEELERLRDAKEAGWAKEAAIQARDAAQETSSEWAKTVKSIEDGLTDSLMRAFESGKGFLDAFKDTLVNAFKTMILQPTIRAIMAPVTAGIGSLFGSGSAFAGQGGGGLSGLMSMANGSMIGGLQTQLLNLGDWLATSGSDALASVGGFLQSNYAGLGSLAGGFGGFMAGRGLGQMIGNGYAISGSGNGVVNTGAAIGTLFGGPIGGAIGGAIGGIANQLFGRKLKDSGIEGTLSTAGITGNAYKFYKGGLFRSNKTERSALDKEVAGVFDAGLAAATAQVSAFVDVLGLPVQALRGYSEQIKISFKDLSEEEIRQAIADSITKFQAGLASLYSGAIAQYQRAGETTLETLQRLAQLEGFSRVLNEFGGVFSTISTLGIDARESLIAMAGGMDALLGKTQQFVADYYTQQEQAALSARGIVEALSGAGIDLAGLQTKEQYRALLESQNLTTDQGQAQFTALLNASAAFAQLAPYLTETGATIESLAALAPAMKELETLFAPGTQADGMASGLELGLSDVSSAVTTSGDSVVAAIEQLRSDLNNGLAVVAGNTGESSRWLRDLYENPGGA